MRPGANDRAAPLRFDRVECLAAFADLGTFIPFVLAYVSVFHMDPAGILLAFGAALVGCGLVYRTPFPVQPMKAVGALAVAQAGAVTAATIVAAGLVSGVLWLLLGLSGAASRLARLVPAPIVQGIVIGLGASFMLQGARMMDTDWPAALLALLVAVALRRSRLFPAMLLLLLGGFAYGMMRNPALWQAARAQFAFTPRLPALAVGALGWQQVLNGALLLALPQLPLTLGNAVIAVTGENNRLFPGQPTSVRTVALTTGAMNLAGSLVGGVPMCHGAGGMAACTAFGARSGGAPVVFGAVLLVLALCFGDSIALLLQALPAAVLGAILFLAGARMATANAPVTGERRDWRVLLPILLTAGLALWNVGLAFLAGMAVHLALRRPRRTG